MSRESNFKINESESQFELHLNNGLAFLEYYREGNKIFLTHTEVPEQLRGKGIAAELVKHTLQYCRQNNLIVVPACAYVAKYIDKNPEWRDILSEGYQM
jgi:predicted GNAT family acetyltransferase